MRLFRALLALVLIVTASRAGEITLLKGDVIKCDVVSVSEKEVVYKVDGKEQKQAITDVLKIEYRDVGKAPDKAYSQVELTDGTTVLASAWSVKKRDFEMKLVAGPAVKVPVAMVANVLNHAKEEKNRREWKTRVFNTRGKEAIVVNVDGVVSNIICTLGDGDAKGEKIKFVAQDDVNEKERTYSFAKMHGLIFKNLLSAKAPPVVCRLLDTAGDVVLVSGVAPAENGGVIVTTPSGAKIEFPADQIAVLDYQKGKLDYLSQLTPAAQTIKPILEDGETKEKWFIYKDSNLSNKPITIAGVPYRFGLTLLPEVELTYNLGGNYNEFSAVVGIDDETKAEGELMLVIEGNGKELASVPIVYKTEKGKNGEPTKPLRPNKKVTLNVKNITTLKIIVKQKDELSGLSISVSLADAKVNK